MRIVVGERVATRSVLQERLINVHTEDGQTVEVTIEPPRRLNEVLILTLESPKLGRVARGQGCLGRRLPTHWRGQTMKRKPAGPEVKEAEPSAPLGENIATVGSGFCLGRGGAGRPRD